MDARPKNWLNLETLNEEFGIEVRISGKWMHAAEAGKPLIYKTEAERDAKLQAIRANPPENPASR